MVQNVILCNGVLGKQRTKKTKDMQHLRSRDGVARLLIVNRFQKMKNSIFICLSSTKVVNIGRGSCSLHSAKRSSVNIITL